VPDTVGSDKHKPTSLRGIANKANVDKRIAWPASRMSGNGGCLPNALPCIAEASITEEPGAEKLHAGVCAGGAG
jgi:hypothetical protein